MNCHMDKGEVILKKKGVFFFKLKKIKKDSPVVKTLSSQIRGQGLDPCGEDPTSRGAAKTKKKKTSQSMALAILFNFGFYLQ